MEFVKRRVLRIKDQNRKDSRLLTRIITGYSTIQSNAIVVHYKDSKLPTCYYFQFSTAQKLIIIFDRQVIVL